jgi:O-acetyl-ADP-ribose deacetylase (regulator of RNase III)
MFVTETDELDGPRWIINFPTKDHWKGSSRLEWVESGLQDLRRVLRERQIKSVAIPPLGQGMAAWIGRRSNRASMPP